MKGIKVKIGCLDMRIQETHVSGRHSKFSPPLRIFRCQDILHYHGINIII